MTSLPGLFSRALATASEAADLPTIHDQTQELIQSALTDLKELNRRVAALSLFSPNEVLEDISTRDLAYLFAPYLLAQVQNRVRTTDRDQRMSVLQQTRVHLRSFLHDLDTYCVVPEIERVLYAHNTSSTNDAAKRREVKIRQFKAEKDLRARIETIRKRRKQTPIGDQASPTDFDIIRSLLPSTVVAQMDDEDEDEAETDEILRETMLLLLRLNYAQASSQLESMDQEFELLQSAPPPPRWEPLADDRRHNEQDDMWKLDTKSPAFESESLLDASGKPLRPFTILPAGASDRTRLQAQVFGPDHRLPTMSIDEYLEIEQERGNILTGGGPQSEKRTTSSEKLAIDSEMDGSMFADRKSEEKRQKDEHWARFKDANARGAGNTMNRG